TYQNPHACIEASPEPGVTHIFLDIRMPAMNGIELCHELRNLYPETVHFIALTAHVLKEERESILREGFDGILSKPFREAELLDVLKVPAPRPKITSFKPDLSVLRQMTLNDEALFQSVVSQF